MTAPLPDGLLRLGAPLPAGLHPEAALLAACRAAGLPVPVGAVLLEGADDLGPLAPGEHVSLRVLGQAAAVRVPTERPAVLAAAVRTARLATPAGARGDVLVLRAVPSVHAGRGVTGPAGPDRVQAVEGEAHEVDGSAEVRELAMPRLERPWHRAHRGADDWRTPLPPWGMRLSRLLRGVRRVAGPARHVVLFADDGHRCRLLGVRAD